MSNQPLADLMRPKDLSQFIGQETLVGKNGPIRKLLESGKLPSMIFWGPPASGKTSLANVIAQNTGSEFMKLSAVMQGKEELKKIIHISQENKSYGKETILFIDEIHRWNKAQQDSLLPYVEDGTIVLIGATTENPSFSIISALLSRCRVFVFKPHSIEDLVRGLFKATEFLDKEVELEILEKIAQMADGDLRFALSTLEIALNLSTSDKVTFEIVEQAAQRSLLYDKNGEEHYNIISAVHKSLRSSNPTAGVYWVVRMLESGDDPLYVVRRLLRFASEDIGNANPNALLLANQVFEATKNLGMPECQTAIVQLTEYLAKSVKNNSAYTALNKAKEDIAKYGSLPVPLHFRNAPTKLMKNLGYGAGYQYDHDLPGKKSDQECMPEGLEGREYF